MSKCGNFLEVAESQNGISVGFGKMMLVYSTSKDVPLTSLNATAIQAEITAGTIIGVIRGWTMITGASVAEKNVERVNGEMELIKGEILADTLTFSDSVENNKALTKAVEQGTLNCILLDDQGYAFGERSLSPDTIATAKFNFSNKVSNGMQNDLTNEKTILVTVRYLLTEIGYLNAGVEVEEIDSKVSMRIDISSITSQTVDTIIFVVDTYNAETGVLLTTLDTGDAYADLDIDASVNGTTVTAAAVFAAGQLTITLTKTVSDFSLTTNKVELGLSTPEFYADSIPFDTADFTVEA